MEMLHPSHDHPLQKLSEEIKDYHDWCFICLRNVKWRNDEKYYYGCVECKHYLHKSCAELPQEINHHFHSQHPLLLGYGYSYFCDSCHKAFEESLRYNCSLCGITLDVKCALMEDIAIPQGHDHIRHFSHQHALLRLPLCNNECFFCGEAAYCSKSSDTTIYGCISCEYFLSKSCAKLPRFILHVFHPHALKLIISTTRENCAQCGVRGHRSHYKCLSCKFHLGLFHMATEPDPKYRKPETACFVCGKSNHIIDPNSSSSYSSSSCVDLKYQLNQSFIELPEFVQHPFHPHNPLVLQMREDFVCDSCHKGFKDKPVYNWEPCDIKMDIKCSLMSMSSTHYKDQDTIQHFTHQHPLVLLSKMDGVVRCFGCQMSGSSQAPIYACVQCDYFLHQSCAKLPKQVDHSLHPKHPLKICVVHGHDYTCSACTRKYEQGFIFRCEECDFNIGVECFLLKRTVKYKYHQHHLLTVFESAESDFRCNSYNQSCQFSTSSNEFKLTERCILRCVECNFNVHLLCGALPQTIKDVKIHIHALSLENSIVEDKSGEYYCDVCEEERDARLCVYYCDRCGFISHVHCVLSQVISALKRDLGEAELLELKTVGE